MVCEFMTSGYGRIKECADAKGPLKSVDYFWCSEAPAGCISEEYQREYPQLAFIGEPDTRALVRGRAPTDQELTHTGHTPRRGGCVVARSDHDVLPDVPAEGRRCLIHRLWWRRGRVPSAKERFARCGVQAWQAGREGGRAVCRQPARASARFGAGYSRAVSNEALSSRASEGLESTPRM